MKYKFLIIIFLFTFVSLGLVANDSIDRNQSERRLDMPLQIAGLVLNDEEQIKLMYNFSDSWTVGIAYWNIHKSYELSDDLLWLYEEKQKYGSPVGAIFLNYFPFDSVPFLLGITVGRNPSITSEARILDSSLFPTTGSYATTETKTYKAAAFGMVTLGYRHLFSSGFLMGFEIHNRWVREQPVHYFTEADNRGLLSKGPKPDPIDLYLNDKYRTHLSAWETNKDKLFQIYAGFSF